MTYDIRSGLHFELGSPLAFVAPCTHCKGLAALDPYPDKYRFPGLNHVLKGSTPAVRLAPNKPRPPPSIRLVRPLVRYGEPVKSYRTPRFNVRRRFSL